MAKTKRRSTSPAPAPEEFQAAYHNVRRFFPPSPLTFSPLVSELLGGNIYFKWDNKLRTGSFKERGAIHFLLALKARERARGVCAASAGNHALALSFYAKRLKAPCTIVMPVLAPLIKVQSSQRAGAEVILHGNNFNEAYQYAAKLARKRGLIFVPAFDHPLIIAGQGSAGIEILEQLPEVDSIVVPVGGGGLISGIAAAIKQRKKAVRVFGVQSEWAASWRKRKNPHELLFQAGTIADGIAVKHIGTVTGPVIKNYVDSMTTVTEDEIANAIMRLLELERTVVEGAGAAAFAALLAGRIPKGAKNTVVMACGSNIDMNILSRLIERDMAKHARLLRIKVSLPDRPGSLHVVSGLLAEMRANVLEVTHDRSFSKIPGNVDVSFLLEVRNKAHKLDILSRLRRVGLDIKEQL